MKNIQVRRGFKTLALTAMLGFAVVGLSQCRMVEDTLTGVELNSQDGVNARSECVQKCNDKYKAAQRAEDARYEAALRACGTNRTCKAAEKANHKANDQQIVKDMQECKRTCYNEGSGGGGR